MTMMESVEEETALQLDCEPEQVSDEYVEESVCTNGQVSGDLLKNSESVVMVKDDSSGHSDSATVFDNQEKNNSSTKEKPVNKSRHVRSHSDCTDLRGRSDLPFSIASSSASSPVDSSFSSNFEENRKPRFLDDGGSSITVASGGHEYPKRKRGQSLLHYLTLNYSSKLSAELDRENAHFSVSEAMITAIEESKFVQWKKRFEEDEDDKLIATDVNEESDEEIRQLRMQLQSERFSDSFSSGNCYRENQASNTQTSISSPMSSLGTVTPSLSPSSSLTSVVAAIDIQQQEKTPEQQDSGISMSFASMYSAAEKDVQRSRKLSRLRKLRSRLAARNGASSAEITPVSLSPSSPMTSELDGSRSSVISPLLSRSDTSPAISTGTKLPPISESALSAENIALALLSHFSQFRVPQESDMEWLVSERDAPQHLLPMPRSWPVNPDEPFMELNENETDDNRITTLRGNWEWAPPRPQIVFAVYSSPNLKVVMAKQNYRCAGCGMKVAPEYCRSYRYCHYLGRYFCTACHCNKTSVIPSRIFKKWDFKKYLVSNFSYDLLERMWFDPLFRLGYINPLLYRRCRQLNKVLELRIQLTHVGEFLKHCRYATVVWDEVKKEAADWLDDPEIYSLYDLVRVNTGELFQQLRSIVTRGMKHIIDCELCKARGFLCEKCHSNEIIFPFQVDTVIRCQKCGSCYHIPCWDSNCCTRCQRMARRSQDNKDDAY